MSVTNRLVFDPADANTKLASSNVGAFVRAGDDGTVIGHVNDALKVDVANSSITVTATALDIRALAFATDTVDVSGSAVTVSATALDIRALAFATDTVDVSGSAITVSATALDIRALSASTDSVSAWTKDGSGNAIGSTSNALDVNIKSGDIDDSLANTAITSEAVSVSTSAVAVTSSALTNRKWLYLCNNANKAGFWGPSGVTTASGFPLMPGEKAELRAGASVAVYYIGGTGSSSQDFRTAQLS
jgi:hypothetical protein